jgi:hypothetical protein
VGCSQFAESGKAAAGQGRRRAVVRQTPALPGELRIARVPRRARSLEGLLSVRKREEFLFQTQVLLA